VYQRGVEMMEATNLEELWSQARNTKSSNPTSVLTPETADALDQGGQSARNYVSRLSTEALEELRTWAIFRMPNYWYILFNGIQIITCLAVIIIGFVCVEEARDDLKANVAFELMDNGPNVSVQPCGYPAPDMLHLLRLQGVYENQLGLPQLIEPDYKKWNLRVQGSMCSSDPYWTAIMNDGKPDEDAPKKARLLHGLATIMGRRNLEPADEMDMDALNIIEAAILNDMCNTESNRTYSKRLETAFGDPLTRIARAYLAAAPAFYAYNKSKYSAGLLGPSCLGDYDPFGYAADGIARCANADYITLVLQRAGSIHNSARLAGIKENAPVNVDTPTWHDDLTHQFVSGPLEMLYALYALSVINHYDKTDNNGLCFKNAGAKTAVEFCEDLYDSNTFTGYTLPTPTSVKADYGKKVLDVNYYRIGDEPIAGKYTCTAPTVSKIVLATSELATVASPPAPPPFVSYRGADASKFADDTSLGSTEEVWKHVIGSCAATLQYGLYDQERLFGVPDVLHFFQHDNRPDASLHFLGGITAQSYFLGPLEEANAFQRPVERLELYLAYRLASLTMWGALVASVAGFFMGRSGVPLVVAVLSLVFELKQKNGVRKTVVQPDERSIFQDGFTILAALVAFITGYYTIFVDPSAQSYYPTTPKCDDYILGRKYDHSAGGAYVTSWGKRRFNRYSETQIGIIIVFVALVPIIYTVTKVFAQSPEKAKQAKRKGMTIFTTSVNTIFLVAAGIILGAQVYNCIATGNQWFDAARVTPYDTTILNDRLGRDCVAMVLISFWVGLALSVNRASWVFNNVQGIVYKIAFFGGCIVTVWLAQISYLALMGDEYEDAFAVPSRDDDRRNAQVISLVGSGLFTGAILVEFWSLQKEQAGKNKSGRNQAINVNNRKEVTLKVIKAVGGANTKATFEETYKIATTHVDPRMNRPSVTFARLPSSREQRSRGQYASMPSIALRH
jgi:hypothetical protein